MDISDSLKRAIKASKMSMAEVASQMKSERSGSIGISQQALSCMIKGNIPFNRVVEIAGIIGVPVSSLLAENIDEDTFVCKKCGQRYRVTPIDDSEEN